MAHPANEFGDRRGPLLHNGLPFIGRGRADDHETEPGKQIQVDWIASSEGFRGRVGLASPSDERCKAGRRSDGVGGKHLLGDDREAN